MSEAVENKKCRKCGTDKPATDEFFNLVKGRLRSMCKVCHRADSVKWRAANPGYLKAYHVEHRARNFQSIRAKEREYYENNKKKINAKQLAKRKLRWSDELARLRKWRRDNPEKVQVWVRNRRAKLRGLSGSHTRQDILDLLEAQGGMCVYCRADIRQSFQVDHIYPVSKGGRNDKSNLQLLCKPCNTLKGARDPIAFAQIAQGEAYGRR